MREFLATLRRRADGLVAIDAQALSDAELAAFVPGALYRLFPGPGQALLARMAGLE